MFGEVVRVAGAGAGRERVRQDVEDDRDRLHPLDRGLQRLVLEGDDHLGLGVDRRVDQAGQRRQVALGARDLELVVPPPLQIRLLQADLEGVLAPFAPDPVGRPDDRNHRYGPRAGGTCRGGVRGCALAGVGPLAAGRRGQQRPDSPPGPGHARQELEPSVTTHAHPPLEK